MAIGSEVFGSCVGGIDVSVEVKNDDGWLCCGGNIWDLFGREKRLKISGGGRRWC